jgi:hypothetical protein
MDVEHENEDSNGENEEYCHLRFKLFPGHPAFHHLKDMSSRQRYRLVIAILNMHYLNQQPSGQAASPEEMMGSGKGKPGNRGPSTRSVRKTRAPSSAPTVQVAPVPVQEAERRVNSLSSKNPIKIADLNFM